MSERRACQLVNQPRGTQRYQPTQRDDEDALTRAVIELASQYGRYGYRRVTALLQRVGWRVGKDRIERIWRREGLKVCVLRNPPLRAVPSRNALPDNHRANAREQGNQAFLGSAAPRARSLPRLPRSACAAPFALPLRFRVGDPPLLALANRFVRVRSAHAFLTASRSLTSSSVKRGVIC